MLVNSATPEEFVSALSVLVCALTPSTGVGVPHVGPLCCDNWTQSPATALPLESSTVTAAWVVPVALVSDGSLVKVMELATPVTAPVVEVPHFQLTTVMPAPHHTEQRSWMGAL